MTFTEIKCIKTLFFPASCQSNVSFLLYFTLNTNSKAETDSPQADRQNNR